MIVLPAAPLAATDIAPVVHPINPPTAMTCATGPDVVVNVTAEPADNAAVSCETKTWQTDPVSCADAPPRADAARM